MSPRILALACIQLVLGGAGLWVIGHQDGAVAIPDVRLFLGFAATLSLLSLLPRIYVEHDRHGIWITPSDSVLLIGLFALGPYGFVAASLVAELAIAIRFRQSPLKSSFNLVTMFGGAVAAATTFAVIGRTDPLDPSAWLAALLALAAVTAWDACASAGVLAVSEGQPISAVLRRLAPAALMSLGLSAALGLVALILYEETGPGVLLFLPVLGILVLSARAVSQQRAERQHLQQLYEASSQLAELASLPSVLGKVATQARSLVVGSAGLCCTVRDDGSWTGVLVDDDGARPAPDVMIAALLEVTRHTERGEVAIGELGRDQRRSLPSSASIVWSVKEAEPAGCVVLAVLRELPTDEQRHHRADILATFVAHAASVVANAQLHTDVRRSLDRQLELNRQKSEFVAAVSHELRTPLAGMIGAVQTVRRLEGRMPTDDRAEMLEMGLSQGSRLQRLIEDLLLVAASDHHDVGIANEQVDLADLLATLISEMGPALGDRFVEHLGAVGAVTTDADKVRRIVVNLLENARKYAPDGPIELHASQAGSIVTIAVRDHGPGIPVDDRERIFERFVQLDQSSTRRQGGTGLGLHLSRELARLLGGDLTAEQAPGGGARFVLTLGADEPTDAPDGGRREAPRSGIALRRPGSVGPGGVGARGAVDAPAPAPVGAQS